jgi:kynurenine formamidase
VNLLGAEQVRDAAACIRTGKRFSLALPLGAVGGDPCLPDGEPSEHLTTQDESHYASGRVQPLPGGVRFTEDSLRLSCHGTTHMDALGHSYVSDQLYNAHPATATIGGLQHASIEPIAARGVVGRAILLDLARVAGVRNLPMGHRITLAHLEEALDTHRIDVRPGDVMILRTGIFRVFYDDGPDVFYRNFDEPGLTYDADLVDFLHRNDVVGVGTDTLCNEQAASSTIDAEFPLHVALQRNLGITFHEALWLEDWAADCADDLIYDAFYVAAPLRVVHGTGGPMNPIVIK